MEISFPVMDRHHPQQQVILRGRIFEGPPPLKRIDTRPVRLLEELVELIKENKCFENTKLRITEERLTINYKNFFKIIVYLARPSSKTPSEVSIRLERQITAERGVRQHSKK
ncbi:hypothetical protein CEXT_555171 [Caerostris extrusa]|uniref:Uncharacterized protein n=1 Tax=Caerostris extrusa TaxID=172846 RepID=A0AAV4Y0V8_CAEEX|nr:hypothetical protein CEXT_555171 [Caerostris extrusa]